MDTFSKQLPASTKKLVIPSLGVIALVTFSFLVIYEATKTTVDVTNDGEKQTVKTHANTVGELLDELGIEVGNYDKISPNLDTVLENSMEIHYHQAKQLFLMIDDEKENYYTTKDTVGEFLREKNLAFSKHDVVSFDEDDEIVEGLTLTVTTAYPVAINDAGKKLKVWTTGGTVAKLLEENEINLNELDKVKPKLNKDIDQETSIKITRVEKENTTVEQRIEFKTEKREDKSLEKGKEKVIEEGKEGIIAKTYEITKENGEEVDRELIEEEVKEEVKNRVIAVGTKEPPPSKDNLVTLSKETNNKSSNGKEMTMTATAYSAVDCTGCDGSGVTATGINLKANPNMKVISVDPNVIPLGTKVWVEGYGNAIAGDTGGAIKGNRIDIHVPSHSEALGYGMKKVKVKILE